jgi:hypothetical protein
MKTRKLCTITLIAIFCFSLLLITAHAQVVDNNITVSCSGGTCSQITIVQNSPYSFSGVTGFPSVVMYISGDSYTITAEPVSGEHFVEWQVDGKDVSSSATYTLTLNSQTTLTAVLALGAANTNPATPQPSSSASSIPSIPEITVLLVAVLLIVVAVFAVVFRKPLKKQLR